MPELPEVETVVRDLRPELMGRRVLAVRAGLQPLRRAWSPEWPGLLTGQRVRALTRRGKWIIASLERSVLLFHLGMTGQLTIGPADRPLEDHTHVLFDLDRARQLRFRDVRRFGSVTLHADEEIVRSFLDARLGPEPFDLDAAAFAEQLARTRRPLKAVLLDQAVVAGVGNIYADESLFLAKLDPRQLGCDTTRAEARRLARAIVRVLTTAIEFRGSSIRNYVGGSGLRGEFQNEFRAYGRTNEPCPRCRVPIARVRLAGRSTHFCPSCQSAARAAARALERTAGT